MWQKARGKASYYVVPILGTEVAAYAVKVERLLRVKPYKMKRSVKTCSRNTVIRLIHADNDGDNNDSIKQQAKEIILEGGRVR